MFSFLLPRHVNQGRAFIKDARKLLAYKRDLVSDETAAEVEREIGSLEAAVRSRDKQAIEAQAQRLDQTCGKLTKPLPDSGWRENCEVFLVAIVIALGVRTYFLQPFTIPTGSMQPTLNGIIGISTKDPMPNFAIRFWHGIRLGRTYVNKTARADETIMSVGEVKSFLPFVDETPMFGNVGFFTRCKIQTDQNAYIVQENTSTVVRDFLGGNPMGRFYRRGEPIVNGYLDAGDHVFVDKVSYHFRRPQRGEVFVFNTQHIATMDNVRTQMQGPSQFYIKRLGGLAGDTLQIRPPELFINGRRAEGAGFERVMSGRDGYRGYSNESEQPDYGTGVRRYRMKLLGAPDETLEVPPRNYFALGDNSFHSSDSRDWGGVPEENVMGRGVFVYWPFTRHWGRIR
jgi:signal peptidase I